MAMSLRHTYARLLKNTQTSVGIRNTSNHIRNNIVHSVYKDIPKLNCNVNEYLWQNLDRWPDKTATVCAVTGRGYTYAQTHRMSMIFAASLRRKLRLLDDDRVAVILPNVPEYPVVTFGVLQAGCVATVMNPAYTAYEFQKQFDTVSCKAVVTSKLSYANVKHALDATKTNIPIILVDHDALPAGTVKFAELAEDLSTDLDCLKRVHRGPDDVAIIPFSSGTTGFPKGVVLTHGALVAFNQMISDPEIVAVEETTANHQTVLPAVLPFFHIFGLNVVMVNHLSMGCKLVTLPQFKPDLFLQSIVAHKASVLFLVPPMAVFLGKHPSVSAAQLASLRAIVCGAAPLSVGDAEAVVAKNPRINFRQGSGMTETSGSMSIGRNTDREYASVGYTLPGTRTKVVGADGAPLGPGEEGELCYSGANLMRGYLNNPQADAECFTEDGWFRAGDRGRYDPSGRVYVTGRIKELIKVKGFQVPPAELESILRTHPKVYDCAVLGIPDAMTGEAPKAFVVVQPNQSVEDKEIQEFVNSKVSDYKRIKVVQFIDIIPKNPAGKILRNVLKEKYC